LSALQSCYNVIADSDGDFFACEWQNDPPVEEGPQDSGITAYHVQNKLSYAPHGLVPDDTQILTAAIDVGKFALHYVVTAWQSGASGIVIDYGVQEVHSPTTREAGGDAEQRATEEAIRIALHSWREENLTEPYKFQSGETRPLNTVLVDAGHWDTTIYKFVAETGCKPFQPSKGFGSGSGYRASPFRAPQKESADKLLGDHWYASKQPNGLWLIGLDTDWWKRWVHDRILTPIDRAGSLSVYGDDARQHMSYGKHLTSEVWTEEWVKGKGLKGYWKRRNKNNHYFDATYMACAAASMCGVTLMGINQPQQPVRTRQPRDEADDHGGWTGAHKGRWT
jgi:phage terminase large subunit GpA-like protein